MTADQQIEFHRMILDWRHRVCGIAPTTVKLAFPVCGDALLAVANVAATREHVGTAVEQLTGQVRNRTQTRKYRYLVATFSALPNAKIAAVRNKCRAVFGESTRTTVLESARLEAQQHPMSQAERTLVFDEVEKGERRTAINFASTP